MKYLIYLGHPAHFHLFRITVDQLRQAGQEVRIVIKKKDVLEDLLHGAGWEYSNILDRERGRSRLATAWNLGIRDVAMFRIATAFRPNLMLGTSAEIAHVGRLLRVPAVVLNEDDWDVVPYFARLAYPFATHILAPGSCRMGRWVRKTVTYPGYHELAYLHPNHFAADPAVAARLSGSTGNYFILRFAKLSAHHDAGRTGISTGLATVLVERLANHGRVYITAERALESALERYRISIPPHEMHHALAGARLYIGDSQTMAAEAAVLGTPSLRFNDFVGQISYLEELEHRYGLTIGIPTTNPRRLLELAENYAASSGAKSIWHRNRDQMLRENIDVAAFLTWFIQNYPDSTFATKEQPTIYRCFGSSPTAEMGIGCVDATSSISSSSLLPLGTRLHYNAEGR